jgi:hypothetical protein
VFAIIAGVQMSWGVFECTIGPVLRVFDIIPVYSNIDSVATLPCSCQQLVKKGKPF